MHRNSSIDENTHLLSHNYILYKRRWFMLAVVVMFNISNAMVSENPCVKFIVACIGFQFLYYFTQPNLVIKGEPSFLCLLLRNELRS